MLKLMTENDIHRDDYMYVKAYEEFLCMRSNKVKYRAEQLYLILFHILATSHPGRRAIRGGSHTFMRDG